MIEKSATLREIEEHWSIENLYDANDFADQKLEAERQAAERNRRRA